MRMAVERDRETRRIPHEISHVQRIFRGLVKDIGSPLSSLGVRLCKEYLIYVCVVRADDKMWVTQYLCYRIVGNPLRWI